MEVTPRTRDGRRDQGVRDEGARTSQENDTGQGGSHSYRLGGVQNSGMIRMLQQQIADLRAHNEWIQAQIDT